MRCYVAFWIFCRCRSFCHRLESELFVLFSLHIEIKVCIYHSPTKDAKEKYRGVFEIQRSGDKTSSGEIGLDIRTHASPKVGQDQVYIWRVVKRRYIRHCVPLNVKVGIDVHIRRVNLLR